MWRLLSSHRSGIVTSGSSFCLAAQHLSLLRRVAGLAQPDRPSPPPGHQQQQLLTERVVLRRIPKSWTQKDDVADFVARVLDNAESLEGESGPASLFIQEVAKHNRQQRGGGALAAQPLIKNVNFHFSRKSGRGRHGATVTFSSTAGAARFLSLVDRYIASVLSAGIELQQLQSDGGDQQSTQEQMEGGQETDDAESGETGDNTRFTDERKREFLTATMAGRMRIEPVLAAGEEEEEQILLSLRAASSSAESKPKSRRTNPPAFPSAATTHRQNATKPPTEEERRVIRKQRVLQIIHDTLADARVADRAAAARAANESSTSSMQAKRLESYRTEELLRSATAEASTGVDAMHAAVQAKRNVEAIRDLERTNLLLRVMRGAEVARHAGQQSPPGEMDAENGGGEEEEQEDNDDFLHHFSANESLRRSVKAKLQKRQGADYRSQQLTRLYTQSTLNEDLHRCESTLNLDRYCLSPDVLFDVAQKHTRKYVRGGRQEHQHDLPSQRGLLQEGGSKSTASEPSREEDAEEDEGTNDNSVEALFET